MTSPFIWKESTWGVTTIKMCLTCQQIRAFRHNTMISECSFVLCTPEDYLSYFKYVWDTGSLLDRTTFEMDKDSVSPAHNKRAFKRPLVFLNEKLLAVPTKKAKRDTGERREDKGDNLHQASFCKRNGQTESGYVSVIVGRRTFTVSEHWQLSRSALNSIQNTFQIFRCYPLLWLYWNVQIRFWAYIYIAKYVTCRGQ